MNSLHLLPSPKCVICPTMSLLSSFNDAIFINLLNEKWDTMNWRRDEKGLWSTPDVLFSMTYGTPTYPRPRDPAVVRSVISQTQIRWLGENCRAESNIVGETSLKGSIRRKGRITWGFFHSCKCSISAPCLSENWDWTYCWVERSLNSSTLMEARVHSEWMSGNDINQPRKQSQADS